MPPPNDRDWRSNNSLYYGLIVFLLGFVVILLLVGKLYLWPAVAAAYHSDARARRALAGLSALVLVIVLVVLLSALILIVRPGRLFFPRKSGPRTRTRYTDAWAEAGKRLTEEEDKPEGDDDGPEKN